MSESFGNYEIVRKLAAGGMAEVFLAKQQSLGGFERLLCIKRILPHLGKQTEFISMFQDEARIAANLIHPNIAQIYDIGEIDDSYYIALEYVAGEDVRRVYNQEVKRGRAMPVEPAAQIVMGAAAGLAYAHKHAALDGAPLGIVHRDISPQNILVSYTGHVKIIDFGVAKAANKLQVTRAGVIKGKYSYMSPEQASGDPIDGRTDIFALGVTLYEITTGTRLFKKKNELETLAAVIECKVTPPSSIIPNYDSTLESIILKCLAFDPNDRYATATELERALEQFLVERSHPTTPSVLGEYMEELFSDELLEQERSKSRNIAPNLAASDKASIEDKSTKTSHPIQDSNSTIDSEEQTSAKDYETEETQKVSMEMLWQNYSSQLEAQPKHTQSPPKSPFDGPAHNEATILVNQLEEKTIVRDAFDAPTISARPPLQRKTERHSQKPRRSASRYFIWALLILSATLGIFELTLNKPVSTQPPPPITQSGPILIQSNPVGATVQFEGPGSEKMQIAFNGHRTPIEIPQGLPLANKLQLIFTYPGHDPIQLPASPLHPTPKPTIITARISTHPELKKSSYLYVTTAPEGATVRLNGKILEGTTPLNNLAVTPNQEHKLTFSLANYEPEIRRIKLKPNQKKVMAIQLTDASSRDKTMNKQSKSQMGYLKVSSALAGTLTLNGSPKGDSPYPKWHLPSGKHTIRLTNANHGVTITKQVMVDPGKMTQYHIAPQKGTLSINVLPWARIFIGKKITGSETPAQLRLYEGDYSVLLVCPNGKPMRIPASVDAGKNRSLSATCPP